MYVCIPAKHCSFKICKQCKYLNSKIYRFGVMAYQLNFYRNSVEFHMMEKYAVRDRG